MPKNYAKEIIQATNRIWNYYRYKLASMANKYSVDTCRRMYQDTEEMKVNADFTKDPSYYLNYGWSQKVERIYKLDERTWEKVVVPFFNAAREYIRKAKSQWGVSDSDEQEVEKAIQKLYAKIGRDLQSMPLARQPIDYEQSIKDTIEKIAQFYEAKVEKIKDKISDKKYKEYKKDLNTLREGKNIEDEEYYNAYGYNVYELFNLDGNMRTNVDKFFGTVKEYVEAKANGFNLDDNEKKLNRVIKLVNLKLGPWWLNLASGSFRDMLLPDTHYMARGNLAEHVSEMKQKSK